jgi:transposase
MSVEALDGGVLRHPGVRSKSCLSLYGLARPATARAASPEADPQATRGQALLLTDRGPSAIITTTAYPARAAIKLILDNHSAHISKETCAWLTQQPADRFEFVFTPEHGSWLNLIEGFFSKLTRSVLRHIRVASKQELKDRLMAAIDHFNRHPVVHIWTYKLDRAA